MCAGEGLGILAGAGCGEVRYCARPACIVAGTRLAKRRKLCDEMIIIAFLRNTGTADTPDDDLRWLRPLAQRKAPLHCLDRNCCQSVALQPGATAPGLHRGPGRAGTAGPDGHRPRRGRHTGIHASVRSSRASPSTAPRNCTSAFACLPWQRSTTGQRNSVANRRRAPSSPRSARLTRKVIVWNCIRRTRNGESPLQTDPVAINRLLSQRSGTAKASSRPCRCRCIPPRVLSACAPRLFSPPAFWQHVFSVPPSLLHASSAQLS